MCKSKIRFADIALSSQVERHSTMTWPLSPEYSDLQLLEMLARQVVDNVNYFMLLHDY